MNTRRSPVILFLVLACILSTDAHASGSNIPIQLPSANTATPQRIERLNLVLSEQVYDSTRLSTRTSFKLKSPYMAVFYSVIPGTVLHGAGHVYAGKIGTGLALFGAELAGLGLMSAGAIAGFGEEESSDRGETAGFVGLVLFFGSWVYDLIESPVAVNKRNARLLEQKPVGVELQTRDGQPRVAVVWRF